MVATAAHLTDHGSAPLPVPPRRLHRHRYLGTRAYDRLLEISTATATAWSWPGPGVEPHATNGCCTSLTGHSNVELDGSNRRQERT
jgi:hypothetical protein